MKEFAIMVAAGLVGLLAYDTLLALGWTPSELMGSGSALPSTTDKAA